MIAYWNKVNILYVCFMKGIKEDNVYQTISLMSFIYDNKVKKGAQ